jgi:hypothetical protein
LKGTELICGTVTQWNALGNCVQFSDRKPGRLLLSFVGNFPPPTINTPPKHLINVPFPLFLLLSKPIPRFILPQPAPQLPHHLGLLPNFLPQQTNSLILLLIIGEFVPSNIKLFGGIVSVLVGGFGLDFA